MRLLSRNIIGGHAVSGQDDGSLSTLRTAARFGLAARVC
jgi:hypothetical protein